MWIKISDEPFNFKQGRVLCRRHQMDAVIVVASVDKGSDGEYRNWAAYIGSCPADPITYDEDLNWELVVNWGQKLPEGIAKATFPHFAKLPYRD